MLCLLLVAGVFDALAASVEFCNPNKRVAREGGGVDVTSELLLMLAEVSRLCVCVCLGDRGGLDFYPYWCVARGVKV